MNRGRLAALVLPAVLAGACDQRLLIGAEEAFAGAGDSNIYWTSGFETGNLSEWWSEPGAARTLISDDAHIVTTGTAHMGDFAAEASVAPPPQTYPPTVQVAEMIRQGILPGKAFYSAWYYLPQYYRIDFYVLLMSLGTRQDALVEGSPDVPLFDVNLNTDLSTGETYFYIWDHLRQRRWFSPTRILAPVGRWFSIEMYMRKATDDTGRVLVWIDGVQSFDVNQVSTTSNPWMRWAIGPLLDRGTTPAPFSVLIDDATIARVPQTVK